MNRKDYQLALDVQSAVNLSGVVRSLAAVTHHLWDDANATGAGTEFVNTHPITILYVAQLAHLCGLHVEHDPVYRDAYEECREWAKQ